MYILETKSLQLVKYMYFLLVFMEKSFQFIWVVMKK